MCTGTADILAICCTLHEFLLWYAVGHLLWVVSTPQTHAVIAGGSSCHGLGAIQSYAGGKRGQAVASFPVGVAIFEFGWQANKRGLLSSDVVHGQSEG